MNLDSVGDVLAGVGEHEELLPGLQPGKDGVGGGHELAAEYPEGGG